MIIRSKHWRNTQQTMTEYGIIVAAFATLIIYLMDYPLAAWQRAGLLLGVNGLIYVITVVARSKNKNTIEKIYIIQSRKAIPVVENVLNKKQLPFDAQQHNKTIHFQIDQESVGVSLKPQALRRQWLINWSNGAAVLVKIHPTLPENETLVESLKIKLDNAFEPKGL